MIESVSVIQISVIIPVYNAEKYISHCLKSLLNQGVNKRLFEIIVIDDGSKDNSVAVVKEFEKENPQIKIYSQENKGVGAARNKGIDVAIGEYLYFIDADDYLTDNGLKYVFDCLGNIEADLVCFKSYLTNTYNLNELVNNKDKLQFDKGVVVDGMDYINKYGYKNEVWWYLINKKYLENLNLKFPEGVWMEDVIFTAQVLINANRVFAIPIAIHRHVKVQTSAMNNKETKHYKKVIYDMVNAAIKYNEIILNLSLNNKNKEAIKKLEIRKQSLVFFLLVRVVKSKLKFKELDSILEKVKTIDAYPISKMLLSDYKGVHYWILRLIVNSKALLYVSCKLFYFKR